MLSLSRRPPPPAGSAQRGYLLLEVLISIVIFAVGVLGMVGLYAATIKSNGDGKYRMDACYLATTLLSRMQADNRGDLSALGALYQGGTGTNGSKYTTWRSEVIAQLPGVSATVNPPTVVFGNVINGIAPPETAKRTVTINVFWQLPGEDVHRYVAHTIIK